MTNHPGRDGRHTAWPLARPRPPLRVVASLTALALTAAALAGILIRPTLDLPNAVAEDSVFVEPAQPFLWLLTAAAATLATLTQSTRRGVLLALWLAVVAAAAALRELDLHVLLNPDNARLINIHPDNAVRFRIDWWLEDGPAAARIIWAIIFTAAAALAVLPFALARYPWPKAILKRRPFAVLTATGLALMILAWLLDDILARIPGAGTAAIRHAEEITELIAPLLVLTAAAILATRPNTADSRHP